MTDKRIESIRCIGYQLKAYPSKHFSYEIQITYANGQTTVICRRYSQFFNLQCKILDQFPLEAGEIDPSRRIIPFLPGKKFFGNFNEKLARKRQEGFDKYLQGMLALPKNISNCPLFVNFCEPKESDLSSLVDRKKSSNGSIVRGDEITGPIALEQYAVIENYQKVQKGEISLEEGQTVSIIEKKQTGWWFAQTLETGEQGWVPATYLEPLYGSVEPDEFSDLPSVPEKFICTNDYQAARSDELSLTRGALVEVITKPLDGWWLTRCNGNEGMFPSAYLRKADTLKAKQIIDKSESISVKEPVGRKISRNLSKYAPPRRDVSKPKPPRPAAPPRARIQSSYMAVADFDNTVDDGITLNNGAMVTCLTKDDSGWWFVESEGRQGWAPSTYLTKVEEPKTTASAQEKSTAHIPMARTNSKPLRPARPPSPRASPCASPSLKTKHDHGISRTANTSVVVAKPSLANKPSRPKIGVKPMDTAPESGSANASNLTVAGRIKPKSVPKPITTHSRDASPNSDSGEGQISVSELRKKLAARLQQ